jgi:beta-galactosidase
VLDACDKQGMLVMDENRHLGAGYGNHSPAGTAIGDLADLATMIQRDRNHPSVIMWSLCNEEGQRNKPEGKKIFAAMTEVVHRYDQTRPITCAINGSWIANGIHDEDIIGANYHFKEYDAFHQGNPNVPMFGSETTNEKTTRGEYGDHKEAGMCTSYNLAEEAELAIVNRPWLAGSYTWTGFDYRGEPNPYGWPDVSNNTGLMDVCGFPKDKYYYFESCWSDKPMVHLLPSSWNWPGKEGQEIRVLAFSNCKRVELFLNGKSLGAQDMPRAAHVEWQVPYAPGSLLAKAYNDDKPAASDEVQTTSAPARIELTTDRTELASDGQDAVVVSAALLDDKGRVVPDQDQQITFRLAGGGKILGTGNGDPSDHDPDRAEQRKTFHGRVIVILQAGSQPASLSLTARAAGVGEGSVAFRVR